MRLILALGADSRAYPETSIAGGDLDAGVVGPSGLAGLLEIQLGMAGPTPSRAVRTAAYLAKLRAAGPDRCWAESFAKDAWSTADALLQWRDRLVGGGWQGQVIGARRVDDLAAAEAAGAPLPPGLEDRLRALIAALPSRAGLRLRELALVERRELLPVQLAALIAALEARGVAISDMGGEAAGTPGSDLRRVQDGLAGAHGAPLSGDGSFVLLEADTALMAAEAVADWLASGPTDAVIVAPDGDTALLDRALKSRGLPAVGLSKASPWRGALQVLPLAFAVAWRPFNPRTLLNLLSLPRPPVSRWAAGRLARALTAEPGVGGAAWERAWQEIETRLLELHAEEGVDAARIKTDKQLADWRSWTDVGRVDRVAGLPAASVNEIAGRVSAWAIRTDAGVGDPLLLGLAAAARALVEAVARLEMDVLPAFLLERVLGQVLADGLTNPAHVAEAGGLRAIRSPAALWAPAARVVWWSFVGPGEHVAHPPWDEAERGLLEAAGVRLEASSATAARIGAGYARAIVNARDHLMLVRPALSGDEQTIAHPLAHQLRPILKDAGERVRVRAERLLTEPAVTFGGRTPPRTPVETIDPPTGVAVWTVPGDVSARLETRSESATSVGRLLNCQLGWFAQDVLGLRPGQFAELPRVDQLFGNLAHEIARRLLPPGPPPSLDGLRGRAAALFEELLPKMAAPLQQPEHAGELAEARERVPSALEALVRLLHDRGLEIVGAELDRQGAHGAMAVHGRIDLLVRRGDAVAALDLKWTRSEKRYLAEIAEGRAVQLLVYRAVIGSDGTPSPGGFFLLRHRRIVAGEGSFLTDDPIAVSQSDDDAMATLVEDGTVWRDLSSRGVLVAGGVAGAAGQRPEGLGLAPPDKPCRFCDLTGLCRVHEEAL